jgi:hypothetical protein
MIRLFCDLCSAAITSDDWSSISVTVNLQGKNLRGAPHVHLEHVCAPCVERVRNVFNKLPVAAPAPHAPSPPENP